MYLKKLKANKLSRETLKGIHAGTRIDCGPGYFPCGSSGPGHGYICLPHGCECAIWDV